MSRCAIKLALKSFEKIGDLTAEPNTARTSRVWPSHACTHPFLKRENQMTEQAEKAALQAYEAELALARTEQERQAAHYRYQFRHNAPLAADYVKACGDYWQGRP